jgi:hypothetical protein
MCWFGFVQYSGAANGHSDSTTVRCNGGAKRDSKLDLYQRYISLAHRNW